MASSRAKRKLTRSAADRRAQIAAGGLLTAGVALVGKAALERDGSDAAHRSGASRAYRVRRKETPSEGIKRIAEGRAEKALEELRGARESDPAGSVHAARKDLKKLRSALRLVRSAIGETRFRSENKLYRDAGRRLSASRDAEVKLETLAGLEERFGEDLADETVATWRACLSEERDDLGDEDALAGQIESAVAEIRAGRGRMDRWGLSGASWGLFAPGIDRTYQRGRRVMKRVQARHGAADVHEWRKRVKDLWYQLRIVSEMWPGLLGETAEQAHELAELLGSHHDLTVLRDDLTARVSLSSKRHILTLIEHRQEELLSAALDLGSRIYAEKNKDFARRLAVYWASWREG